MVFFYAVTCMDEDSEGAGDLAEHVIIDLFKHYFATKCSLLSQNM